MPNETQQLEARIAVLEGIIAELVKSDRYISVKHFQFLDGRNMQLGKGIGTKFGTETTQLMGFYGVTPIAQRSGSAQAAVATTGAITGVGAYGYSESQANAIVTLVNELRAWAVAQGFIKGSS